MGTFGLDYQSLDFSEKRMIWYFSIQRAHLDVIKETSGIALSDILGESKMAEEDCNYAKILTMTKVDTPSFKQIFVGGQYKIPAIIQILALNGELYGMLVRVYNPEKSKYEGSIFLIPSNTLANYNTAKSKPSSKKRVFSVEDYRKKFNIIDLLESYGYDKLFSTLIKQGTNSQPTINLQQLTSNFSSHVAPLEHYLNITDLIRLSYSVQK